MRVCTRIISGCATKRTVLRLGKMNLHTKFDYNQTTNKSNIVDTSLKVR